MPMDKVWMINAACLQTLLFQVGLSINFGFVCCCSSQQYLLNQQLDSLIAVDSLNTEFSQLEEARWYLSSTKSSGTVTSSFSMNFLSVASFIPNQHFVWCGQGGFDFRLLSASPGAALEIELLSRTCLIRHTGIWSHTDEQRFAARSTYCYPELKSSFLPKRRNPPNPQRC